MPSFTPGEIAMFYRARVPRLKQRGKEWRGPCPVHKGKRDSFAVDAETGRAYCHSECNRGWGLIELEQQLSAVDSKAARANVARLIGDTTPAPTGKDSRRRIVAQYPYTDEAGNLLFEVVRYEPKGFAQRRRDERGNWVWNVKGVRTVLFRLPRVIQADTVYVVEGEKDVETLEVWGLTATCNPGGAEKWRADHARALKGKHVVILPDNDAAGARHAEQVRKSLENIAASVRTVAIPDLPEKGDISDWKDCGGTVEQLMDLLREKTPVRAEVPVAEEESRRFRVDDSGVYLVDLKGNAKDKWMCPRLDVLAHVRDFNSNGWGAQIRFRNREGHERTCMLPLPALVGEGKESIETLLDMGFNPGRDRKSIEAVKDYIYQADPKSYIRCVKRVGWHGNTFVLPDRSIGSNDSEQVLFYTDGEVDHKYRVAGTLDEWQKQVGRLCSGNTRLVFAVSCAFAAPLLDLLKAESAGFHLRGLSSTGKTTALLAAGSVWGGNSQTGFVETWRATSNGIEARAALHNHALLCLDEIGEVRDVDVGAIVYALGNGTGKSRMDKRLASRAGAQFKLLFLSTGERSLSDVMQGAGKQAKGGQEARLTEIPAEAGRGMGMFECLHEHASPDQMARALAHASKTVYGSPIIAFLNHVIGNREDLTEEVRRLREQFVKKHVPSESAGEVFRVASSFGLVAATGEITTFLRITPWKPGEALESVETCFLAWLERRGGTGARDLESGIRAVRNFVQVHGASRFHDLRDKEARVVNRAGFKQTDSGEALYFILPGVFQDEVCRGYDHKEIARELIRRGHMGSQAGKHLTIKKRIDGEGNPRVYAILPTLFSDDDETKLGTVGTLGTEISPI
jgi:uncharacterized protein (DUF927 family)/5S rRNA maturation endonuclease (ribonuclease M5)